MLSNWCHNGWHRSGWLSDDLSKPILYLFHNFLIIQAALTVKELLMLSIKEM